ncbi:YesK-like protein [Shewanella violacea]|uniref:YesK-like protein n=1 Tax=Shewanella violacea (strain JCM 10179 / CIP 106290 / LMG 19151 / DSS12) TaxID=637905 RepID=D4ZJ02_SHEVD|nr:hypothetical protein SVI_1680 [Shewanella violacea DSS12]
MSAGIPLFLSTILSMLILIVWTLKGSGSKKVRVLTSGLVFVLLISCWVVLLSYGVFHPAGSWGMALGFLIALFSLLIPAIGNRLVRDSNS